MYTLFPYFFGEVGLTFYAVIPISRFQAKQNRRLKFFEQKELGQKEIDSLKNFTVTKAPQATIELYWKIRFFNWSRRLIDS